MNVKLIVLVKQVPDTKNVTADAMKADGTVNRGALPAIFNPEDLNALEMALEIKEHFGGMITVITMGPPRAANVLREALYRGADRCILLTDRLIAGADTLATSYTLALAIKKTGKFDMVLCGRQAIDGDTAQIGPQVAEKIGVNQITYTEKIIDLVDNKITISRTLGRTIETIQTELPILITVPSSANQPRPFGAKLMMKYKKARTCLEVEQEIKNSSPTGEYAADILKKEISKKCKELSQKNLLIETWTAADLDAEPACLGLKGSPTKVKKVQSVVISAVETKTVKPTEKGVRELFSELIEERTFG